MPKSLEPGRSTASRIFAVLGAFETSGTPMALREVAVTTGLPVSTVFRITRDLLEEGVLEHTPDGALQIGLRLWELGSLAPRQRRLRRLARPVMEGLYELTDQTVQLVVAESDGAVCVEKISGRRSVRNVTEVAGKLPLHATAVGKVILAFSPEHNLEKVGRREFPRFTRNTHAEWEGLVAEIEDVRRERVGFCRDEMTPGTSSVAAPVFRADGTFVAALGILTATPRKTAQFVPPVREAAETISRRLGHGVLRPAAAT